MNGHHSYLLVEGQQDVLFVGRLLQELGLQSVRGADEIPARWQPFVDTFLRERDRALRAAGREGIPLWQMYKQACLYSATHVVVVEKVGGYRKQFGRTLRGTNELMDGGLGGLTGVGIIPDADTDPGAALRSAQDAIHSAGLAVPANDQQVVAGAPNTGIFVLPGNGASGGLEEILLDCADTIYPSLATSADAYVDSIDIDSAEYTLDDMREMRTPQGPVKARVGAISAILKPGSTIQTSILRDRWVCAATVVIPRLNALATFLRNLCELP